MCHTCQHGVCARMPKVCQLLVLINMPMWRRHANFSTWRANMPRHVDILTWHANVPKGVPFFQLACQTVCQFFNYIMHTINIGGKAYIM